MAAADAPLMRVIGRLAESEDPVLFARFDEVDKCEFIKANAPKEAWEAWTSSDDDGAGLLVKADALREQAREVLVSAARSRTSSLPQPAKWALTYFRPPHPPARLPQGQGVRLAAKKQPAAKGPTAAIKTAHASCRRLPPPAPATRPTNLLLTDYILT